MLGAPPPAVLHSELPGPLLLPISTTTEGQTEGPSVIGLRPLQPPPLGEDKACCLLSLPAGLGHITLHTTLLLGLLSSQKMAQKWSSLLRPARPTGFPLLERHSKEGGLSEEVLPADPPHHTHFIVQSPDTTRHKAGTWQTLISSFFYPCHGEDSKKKKFPPQTGTGGRSGCSESCAILPSACPAWPGPQRQEDRQGVLSRFTLHCPQRKL